MMRRLPSSAEKEGQCAGLKISDGKAWTIVQDVPGYAEKAAPLTRPAAIQPDPIGTRNDDGLDDLRRQRLHRRIDRARGEKTGHDPYSGRPKQGEDRRVGQ